MVNREYPQLAQLDVVVACKKLVEIYYHQANRNISETARVCGLSRHTVRKWLGRYMPCKTPDEVEGLVVGIRKATNYGSPRITKTLHRKQEIILCYGAVQKILKRRCVRITLVLDFCLIINIIKC